MINAFKIVSALTLALFLLQSVLAAQGFWRADAFPDLINIHGIAGNVLFLLVVVQTGLALIGATRRLLSPRAALLNLAILGLVVAQIGLGYTGRANATAVSWHVPNGVLLFGLAVLNATPALSRQATARQEPVQPLSQGDLGRYTDASSDPPDLSRAG